MDYSFMVNTELFPIQNIFYLLQYQCHGIPTFIFVSPSLKAGK